MADIFFTITGTSHYFGNKIFERKMKVKLVKEPDNDYDKEAIRVELRGLGKVGYVANSPYTVLGESISAGRLYDLFGKEAEGRVCTCLTAVLSANCWCQRTGMIRAHSALIS